MNLDQLLVLCAQQGVELDVRDGALDVYFDQTPDGSLLEQLRAHKAELLHFLEQAGAARSAAGDQIARRTGQGPAPLSFGQQRLWFLDQVEGGSTQYHLCRALRFDGVFDEDAAELALARLVARHEPLRTVFQTVADDPAPLVRAAAGFTLGREDLRGWTTAAQQARIEAACAEELSVPFDLGRDLMVRARCLRTAADAGVLLLNVHHIAADGWSLAILIDEFTRLYQVIADGADAGAADQAAGLAPLALCYGDFAAWQRTRLDGALLDAELAHWSDRLQGLPPVHGVPLDRPRPARQDFRGALLTHTIGAGAAARLAQLAQEQGATLFMGLHAVFALLLSRYARDGDVVLGTPVANRPRAELEALIGYFANTLVLRTAVDADVSFRTHLDTVRDVNLEAQQHQELPFELLVERLNPVRSAAHAPLFQIMFAMNTAPAAALSLPRLALAPLEPQQVAAKFDLTLNVTERDGALALRFEYNCGLFDAAGIARMAAQFEALLEAALAQPDAALATLDMRSAAERAQLRRLQDGAGALVRGAAGATIHGLFEQRAAQQPADVALACGDQVMTYADLNVAANRLAGYLRQQGVGNDTPVGVCIERSADLVVALLAVLKAGGAYVPLDPGYPAARLAYMVADSGVALVLTRSALAPLVAAPGVTALCLEQAHCRAALAAQAADNLAPAAGHTPASLAYLIYTSGSTGQPKGVMIEHRGVTGFLRSVEHLLGGREAVWLGLTAISFDISVLEIFGALLGGARLVLAAEEELRTGAGANGAGRADGAAPLQWSLFYFASAAPAAGATDIYALLLDGARFADNHGFTAVWTPERHFAAFGGAFPNPAVTGAAVAAVTRNVQIRAGSCVLPLNDPLKVAEDWSVIDNLSGGRAGLAFASGWNPNDFALAPDNFARRHQVLFEGVDLFRSFWGGASVHRRNGAGEEIAVRLYPAPRQAQPPVWITAAGAEHTFREAGRIGANVLTHLLGQTRGELAEKIAAYRQARSAAGHAGPGHVTLMVHAFVAPTDAEALDTVRQPFKDYLATSLNLINAIRTEASAEDGAAPDDGAILETAFQRYARSSALFGSVERCAGIAGQLQALGVDELACLIDFGVAQQQVMDSLPLLAAVKDHPQPASVQGAAQVSAPVAGVRMVPQLERLIARHGVTHLQCTPSMAAMLLAEPAQRAALRGLRGLLVGGEACPPALAAELVAASGASIHNMYGPTEATVWASTEPLVAGMDQVPIGRALANTRLYVADAQGRPAPYGVPGELLIGGAALARGYWRRAQLSAERFIEFDAGDGNPQRVYRSGDLVRYLADGRLQFLGRIDDQVKLRGFRIELGEIEAQLVLHPAVLAAAAVVREGPPGLQRLLAYVVRHPGADVPDRELAVALRTALGLVLPDYMVPSAVMVLEALPLTPNGKLDRRALPAPVAALPVEDYVAPATPVEQAMAELWANLLRLEPGQVSAASNFFDLGGHSLLLMRLAGDIRQRFQIELSIREAFEAPTLAQLAARVAQRRQAADDSARFERLRERASHNEQEVVL